MTKLTGGEAVVQMLALHGIRYAFGMGGFQILPYYDALARQGDIRHVLIRDEKHGAFAADAYARVANRPAVADATLGPGATNLVSGAAESFGASVPLLLVTGEVNSAIRGRAATQESDQFGMLRPTTKASIHLDRIERVPELVRRAVSLATSGRPGPVHVNVPEEVMHGTHDFPAADLYADPESSVVGGRRVRAEARAIDRVATLLRDAERPLLIVGGGIHLSSAYDALSRFSRTTGIPVAYTMSGKGGLPDTDAASVGLVGRYSRYANDLARGADVVLAVGCKLGEIATDRWQLLRSTSKLIHVDIDPGELGKVYRADVGVWSDARLFLEDLLEACTGLDMRGRLGPWLEQVDGARAHWTATAEPGYRSEDSPVHVARLLRELRAVAPADSIIVADGGFAAHWSALLYDVGCSGRTYIANRGHAAIGYGLPGAIGAKLAAPDKTVFALCGDNGFAMAVAELETARRIGADVVVIVVDNAALGYVKALQHNLYADRFISSDFADVDYAEVARAFGCFGIRVSAPGDLHNALRQAMQQGTPAVVDVLTTRDAAKMLPGVDSRTAGRADGARSS